MKKYRLQDVVSNGSNARKNISSDLLIGDVSNGYGQGDILDANATKQIIQEEIENYQGGGVDESVIKELHDKDDEYEQRISQLESSSHEARVVDDILIIGM